MLERLKKLLLGVVGFVVGLAVMTGAGLLFALVMDHQSIDYSQTQVVRAKIVAYDYKLVGGDLDQHTEDLVVLGGDQKVAIKNSLLDHGNWQKRLPVGSYRWIKLAGPKDDCYIVAIYGKSPPKGGSSLPDAGPQAIYLASLRF